jgi:preprotein translocase subunit SecD
MQLRELNALSKKIKTEIDGLRDSFKGDLRAALEDSEENPKVRHSEDEKIHVYLSVRKKYKYSEKLITKRQKLDNQMADLKAEEAKEVRNNKATLLSQSYTVSFKG